MIDETEAADKKLKVIQAGVSGAPEKLVVQAVNGQDDLAPYVGKTLGQIAQEEGKHHVEVMLDLSLAGDLNVEFLQAEHEFNAPFNGELLTASPYTLPGVSDGGAHTKFFNGGSWTTDLLRWLVRDEGVVTLEEAHFRMSTMAAHAAGFKDRGALREGAAADVVVYELEELDMDPSWLGEVAYDFPGGEWRRIQRAKGYKDIIVNGEVTFEDGECTGATPGRLLRHGRAD